MKKKLTKLWVELDLKHKIYRVLGWLVSFGITAIINALNIAKQKLADKVL